MKINHFNGVAARYEAPTMEVVELLVEQGFAASGGGFSGWEDGEADDDNTNDMGDF